MKSVWKTSEFWAAIMGNVIGLVVAFGALTPAQGAEMVEAVNAIVGGVLSVITILGFINAQSKRKSLAVALMTARVNAISNDTAVTVASSVTCATDKLMAQL